MKKILIVDDDKRVVRMLEEYMKLYNFQTLCAGNGKDALALYDETVDLIILDINMQGMDGVEVCRRIRKQGNVPIIMLSANAASFDKVDAKKQKACSKAGFLNLAPLTGIAFAINWLIGKLNLKLGLSRPLE